MFDDMKMLYLLLFLILTQEAFTQASIIYPAEGSVFQHNQGVATLNFSGQINNPTPSDIRYFKIEKKNTSLNNWSVYNSYVDVPVNSTFLYKNSYGDKYSFYHTLPVFGIGWYRISVYTKLPDFSVKIEDIRQFGIGDVYYVAGQSNASGYYDNDTEDNTVPYYAGEPTNDLARVFSYGEDNGSQQSPLTKGLPYKDTFKPFIHGSTSDLIPIYPNGVSSWCWSILANKIANDKGIPTVFFNVAYPNTSLIYDWIGFPNTSSDTSSNTLIGKFIQTLRFYGGTLGAKAVLWHQGERDSQNMLINELASVTSEKYAQYMNDLILKSRNTLSSNLSWYISKVSFFTGGNWDTRGHIKQPFNQCIADRADLTNSFILQSIKDWQTSLYNSPNRVYGGVDTDIYGADKNNDNIIDTECERASKLRVHFTDNSLKSLASGWYSTINTNYSDIAYPHNKLLQLISVSQENKVSPDSSQKPCCYPKLTIETLPQGTSKYYWIRNDAGINNAEAITTVNHHTFYSYKPGDILSCYVENNGMIYACQPFKYPPFEENQYIPCPENIESYLPTLQKQTSN